MANEWEAVGGVAVNAAPQNDWASVGGQPTTVEELVVTGQRPSVPLLEEHDHGFIDKAKSGGRGFLDGLTLGAYPYVAGAVRGIVPGGDDFQQGIAHEKQINKEAFAANPVSYGAGEVASFAVPILGQAHGAALGAKLGVKGLQGLRATGTIPTIKSAAAWGAGTGAVRGATGSEEPSDIPLNMVEGAALGGLTGGGVATAGRVLPLAGNLGNRAMDVALEQGGITTKKIGRSLLANLADDAAESLKVPNLKELWKDASFPSYQYLKSEGISPFATFLSPNKNIARLTMAVPSGGTSLLNELAARGATTGAIELGQGLKSIPVSGYAGIGSLVNLPGQLPAPEAGFGVTYSDSPYETTDPRYYQ